MTAVFDRSWQERVLEGDADAALLLGRCVLGPLYELCYRQLGDENLSQQVVNRTLVLAISQVRSYHPETYGGDVWRWIVKFALPELRPFEATPNHSAQDSGAERAEVSPPDPQFIYRVEAAMCLAAKRHREASGRKSRKREFHSFSEKTPIACPACGRAYQISATRLGQRARCSSCGLVFKPTSASRVPTPSPAEDRCWYLQRDKEAEGPYAAAELREKVSAGEIPATALVRRGDVGEWQPAVQAEGLFAAPPPPDAKEVSELPIGVVAPPPPQPPPLPCPQGLPDHPKKIGRFEIREWIGRGGFADVYRAYDPVLERELALKVATSAALDDDHVRPFVLREPKAAAKLRHPHIVAVHDAGFDEKRFYMAIDFISGCTLRERLGRGALTHDEAVQLVISLAEALDYAHRSKVLHRDVKPSNIMVDDGGQALLMDFGLARIEHTAGEAAEAKAGFHGTPGYMPPEQISRDYGEVGPHSDQYSLGVVLYELFCGQPPFEGPLNVLIHNTLHVDPVKPGEIDESIDRDVEAICMKATAKRPEDRYASCGELAEDLRRYQGGRATIARPLALHERLYRWCRREPTLAVALGTCATLLLLLLTTLAVFAAVKTRLSNDLAVSLVDKAALLEKEKELSAQKDGLLRDKESLLRDKQQALDSERKARREAIKQQAIAYFRHGHAQCDNGQIPQGLVYLVESLRLAEEAEGGSSSWTSTIRLSLGTWRRQLHVLQSMLRHRPKDVEHQPRCVAIHPQKYLAVIGTRTDDGGGAICIWDVSTENPWMRRCFELPGAADAVAFAPDGKTFGAVGTDADGTGSFLRVWRWKGDEVSEEEPRLTGREDRFKAIAFSPDGRCVLVAGESGDKGFVHELSLKTLSRFHEYEVRAPVRCVAYSPDGKCLAIGVGDSESSLRRISVVRRTGQIRQEVWSELTEGVVHDVAFSRDGKFLAAAIGANLRGEARVWNAATGDQVGGRLRHLAEVYAVTFSPDDGFLLTASQDRSACLWDRFSSRLLGHPLWHGRDVRDVAFLPSGEGTAAGPLAFISVSDDGAARRWDVALGTPVRADRIGPLLFAGTLIPGTEEVAVASASGFGAGRTCILNASKFPLGPVSDVQHEQPATALAVDSKKRAIVGLQDGRAFLVDLDNKNPQALQVKEGAQPHSGIVLSAAISGDNQRGATAGEDGRVWLWDMATGEPIRSTETGEPICLNHPGKVYAVAFDPRSANLLTAGTDGKVRFWHRETGEAIRINGNSGCLDHPDAILCCAYSEGASMLGVGFAGGAQIWCRDKDRGWRPVTRIEAETGISRVHLWPERELVATGDLDGNVRFWHTATGEPIGPALPNQGRIVMLIPWQGYHVLSGAISGSVRRWPLPLAISEDAKYLRRWVQAITGISFGEQQALERIGIADWVDFGKTAIDEKIALERRDYGRHAPRVARAPSEMPQSWLTVQDLFGAGLNESPTFRPPPLEYMDRYLPADTEAVVGLDVRQVLASPLLWTRVASGAPGLLEKISDEWGKWVNELFFHPLFDIEYVLLAAPRGSFDSISDYGPERIRSLTLVVKRRCDVERLWSEARRLASAFPNELQCIPGPGGTSILQIQKPLPDKFEVFATLIEAPEGATLLASGRRETIERALDASVSHRLDEGFRSWLANIERNHSVWFAARREVLDPDSSIADSVGTYPAVSIERIEGGLTVFVRPEFAVSATYPDAASAALGLHLTEFLSSGVVEYVTVQAEQEGRRLTVSGRVLPKAIASLNRMLDLSLSK